MFYYFYGKGFTKYQLFQKGVKVEMYYRECIPLAGRHWGGGYSSLYGNKSVRIPIEMLHVFGASKTPIVPGLDVSWFREAFFIQY